MFVCLCVCNVIHLFSCIYVLYVQGKRQPKVQSRKDSVKVRLKTKDGGSNASNPSVRDSRLSRDSGLDEQTSPQPPVQSEKKYLLSSSATNYSSLGTVERRGVCVHMSMYCTVCMYVLYSTYLLHCLPSPNLHV